MGLSVIAFFFHVEKKNEIEKLLSAARNKIAEDLNLVDHKKFSFCWIIDYPMFELDEKTNKIKFSHNHFQCRKEM